MTSSSARLSQQHNPAAPPAPYATRGNLEVRLARRPAEVEASQRLRYAVFYEEMNAQATPEIAAAKRDFDRFDSFSDHLLVLDRDAARDMPGAIPGGPAVVGTYRLLRQEVANRHGGFYTQNEFDIESLIRRLPAETQFLELGRSCTHKNYRTKAGIELLWAGIVTYLQAHDLDVMFGCASLPGTDPDAHAAALSYLHYEHSAPEEWAVRAHEQVFVPMDRMPKEEVDLKTALRGLPPLIKGYIRAGAYIGHGAYIDPVFQTTDVLIVFPVSRIDARYRARFGVTEPAAG